MPLQAFAATLGMRDVADLQGWGVAINTVAADVAEQCDSPWTHTPDTPVVVLLRAIGRLAGEHRNVTTLLGEALLVMIEAADGQRSRAA